MSLLRLRSGCRRGMVCNATAAMALLALACAALPMHAQQLTADAGWRDVSLAEYHQQLLNLDALVAACQAQHQKRDAAQPKGAAQNNAHEFRACDPARIGPDDHVQLPPAAGADPRSSLRLVALCTVARSGKGGTAQPAQSIWRERRQTHDPRCDSLLTAARQRLQEDAKQVESRLRRVPSYTAERKKLNTILAQKRLPGRDTRCRPWNGSANGLTTCSTDSVQAGALRSRCAVDRVAAARAVDRCNLHGAGLVPRAHRTAIARPARSGCRACTGAPSAREWQLWLKDAQAMAAKGQWREAIHFIYWASIARLESRRLWPADRARTPREYLALLAGNRSAQDEPDGADAEFRAHLVRRPRGRRLPTSMRRWSRPRRWGWERNEALRLTRREGPQAADRLPGRGDCAGIRDRVLCAQRKQTTTTPCPARI